MALPARKQPVRSAFSWDKFDDLVAYEPSCGCWIWMGSTNDTGYGVIWKNGRHLKAHRLSYERHRGIIPDALPLLHSCDFPPCVNPDHLRPGTHSENFKDMWRKGRGNIAKGEAHASAVLTEESVRTIHADQRAYRIIADEYGVARSTVNAIKSAKIWKHLALPRLSEIGHLTGSKNRATKLSPDNVRQIRGSKESGPVLAVKYGVRKAAINDIRSGKTWRHVV